MPLTFHAAVPADLTFILDLVVRDNVGPSEDAGMDPADPCYREALAALDADPNQELLVARLDGEPVGCLQLTYIPGLMRRGMWRLLVEMVHIAPDYRSRGLGSEMMAEAHRRGRARGCGMVQLTSNKARADAHRFYRRLGYQQSHEGFKFFL
jgi:GNAT superfamily N-acetyltransferase